MDNIADILASWLRGFIAFPALLLKNLGIINDLGAFLLVSLLAFTLFAAIIFILLMFISSFTRGVGTKKKLRKIGVVLLLIGVALDYSKIQLNGLVNSYTPTGRLLSARAAIKPKTDAIDAEISRYVTINSLTLVPGKEKDNPWTLVWNVEIKKAGEYQFSPMNPDIEGTEIYSKNMVYRGIMSLNEGNNIIKTHPTGFYGDPCVKKTIDVSINYISTNGEVYGADYPEFKAKPGYGSLSDELNDTKRNYEVMRYSQQPVTCLQNQDKPES